MSKPKIRVKGYKDDWEQRKVTDLSEIYIGLVTTMTEHYTDKGHLLIRNSDIKDGYFEFGENPIYLDEEFSEQNKSRMHQLGDVITVHTGDIGTSAVIGENEVNSIGFATIITRPNQEVLDSNYFATYLNTHIHKQWAISMATGDGRSNYNLKDYTKLEVPIPQIEEQKKIAACVGNLNHLITLHQRKCDETKKLKKYMLQKMFPQNGNKVPEIRFFGFTDDWEQRKLGDVFEQTTNFVNLDEDKMELWSLTVEDGLTPKSERYNREFLVKKDTNFKEVRPGDIVYNPMNMTLGAVGYNGMAKSVAVSGYYTTMVANAGYDSYYINTWLKSPYAISLYKTFATGSLKEKQRVQFPTLSIIPTVFPKTEEQKKIGQFFENLDRLITLHHRKYEELQKIKKFMLQNMFV